MKEGHEFRFEPSGETLVQGQVFVDNRPMTASAFKIDVASGNGVAYVTLTLICRSIEIKPTAEKTPELGMWET